MILLTDASYHHSHPQLPKVCRVSFNMYPVFPPSLLLRSEENHSGMWALRPSRLGLRQQPWSVLLIAKVQEKLLGCTLEQLFEEEMTRMLLPSSIRRLGTWNLPSVSLGYYGDPDPIHLSSP